MENIIYSYTRAQALKDGVLVNVSEMAKEAGFKIPVAVTHAVWHEYVVPDVRARGYQDIEGRLWDILKMLLFAIKSGARGSQVSFTVSMIMKAKQRRNITFKAICHPGDDLEPVITIMLPDED